LEDVATRTDRICVLNILGNESRSVTPVSHAYSGGNIVFGTAPGKKGQVLETSVGGIPVFNNVREGLEEGHGFNVGVVYLPPNAVRHGFYELVRVNRKLEKVVIITEKVPVHDAREIRAAAQQLGVDVFGANCLGVADSWNRVRIGGALGGDAPQESLRKGSVAIFSNSGNFTTTIATYLAMSGWGTTTLISSGKDLYVHFAAPEFAYAFANDSRSQAAVMYVEPGGYYEKGLTFTKPVVACVVGRWKSRLTRPVGHAGAMAGSGDSAVDKVQWFQEALGVDDLFYPDRPTCSARGAVVDNIAHVPAALDAVMSLRGAKPDFEPNGDLSLKPWFVNDQRLSVPEELQVPKVQAPSPYGEAIAALDRQVGATIARTSMKDASAATRMDPTTQVSSLHRVSVLELGERPLESVLCYALLRSWNDASRDALANVAITASALLHGTDALAAAEAARRQGNAPNAVLAAALAMCGPRGIEKARSTVDRLVERAVAAGVEPEDETSTPSPTSDDREWFRAPTVDPRAQAMLTALRARNVRSVFLRYLERLDVPVGFEAVLGAVATSLAWGPLRRKRISRHTARNLPWYLQLFGVTLGASAPGDQHTADGLLGRTSEEWLSTGTATDLSFAALAGRGPRDGERSAIQMLLGLLVTNGPGTISAQGAKGSVSADGPETPERVQINQAMLGFLTHTGFSHGGNGYEGIIFLRDRFDDSGLDDPSSADPGIDLDAIARRFALRYRDQKAAAKAVGESVTAIPGINHPVFRGKPKNADPREVFIHDLFARRGEHNVFHEFYRVLVQVLHQERVTPNVFAVNVDAVIAAVLLKLFWPRVVAGDVADHELEDAAFLLFLHARAVGALAEIDDHLNRGRNMDTRTPASQCRSVS
jgi:succinyl-CoA synthetase alpha subunit